MTSGIRAPTQRRGWHRLSRWADRYFEEVLALVAAGTFSEEELRRLRLRYDTEEPDDVPPGHWSEPQ